VTHAAWLRRLAAGLLRDPDAAEDVVQSTLVAAWRNPPRADRDVRPWLAEVARNQAHDQRRGEGRRRTREAVAHEAAVVANRERSSAICPEALIGELEVHRQVAEVVAGLAEPYRSTVVLHYYDGLDSTEVAQRLGVAAGTIRWRLKEGLEQIRTALDQKNAGERARWQRALLPLVPLPAGVMGATGSGALGADLAGVVPGTARVIGSKVKFGGRALVASLVAGIVALMIAVAFWPDTQDSRRTSAVDPSSQATSHAVGSEGGRQIRRVPRLVAPVTAAAPGAATSAPQLFAEQVLDRMLGAIVDDAYESFIGHGGDIFNAQVTREKVTLLNKEFGKRLAGGFDAESLGSLQRTMDPDVGERLAGPYTTHLWKLGFRDAGDDAIVYLSLKDGQVIGFFVQ
jgi:RNA polymerase sigma-70 factor (ECF subfamily)